MTPDPRLLFTPLEVRGLRLPNRVVLPAMVTRLAGEDGYVNGDIRDRYLRFARGEPGLIVLEAMGIHGARSGPLLRISGPEFVPGLRDLARAIRSISPSRVVPQVIHFLKISRSGWRQKFEDLSAGEIGEIVRQYGDAAARAREAEFDGVELHMAHAYTVASSLSLRNARRDEYGGRSLENRMRLAGEVLGEARRRAGDDFPVGVRFLGEEGIRHGYSLPDARQIGRRLAKLGADWLSLSSGGKFEDAIMKPGEPLYPYTGFSGDRCMPPAAYPDGCNAWLAAGVREEVRTAGLQVPVIATGKIRTFQLAERILRDGEADAIGIARQLLADPDWPRKVRDGREDRVIRCVYGNICKALDENFEKVRCVLWPQGALQAPDSADPTPPAWSAEPGRGEVLRAFEDRGRIRLEWTPAIDSESVYGYAVYRSVDAGSFEHHHSVQGNRRAWHDEEAVGDREYRYYIEAYDLAGNRSTPSNHVTVSLAGPVR